MKEKELNPLMTMALCVYVGETCPFCKQAFKSIEDMLEKNPVWYPTDSGRLACKTCYEDFKKAKDLEDQEDLRIIEERMNESSIPAEEVWEELSLNDKKIKRNNE